MYVYLCMCMCICVWVCICVCVCACMWVCMRRNKLLCICISTGFSLKCSLKEGLSLKTVWQSFTFHTLVETVSYNQVLKTASSVIPSTLWLKPTADRSTPCERWWYWYLHNLGAGWWQPKQRRSAWMELTTNKHTSKHSKVSSANNSFHWRRQKWIQVFTVGWVDL